MSRTVKNRRRAAGRGASAQLGEGDARPNPGVTQRTGRERPDTPTTSPVVPDDPKARVIKIYARNAAPSA